MFNLYDVCSALLSAPVTAFYFDKIVIVNNSFETEIIEGNDIDFVKQVAKFKSTKLKSFTFEKGILIAIVAHQ